VKASGLAANFSFDKYTRQARLKPSLLVLLPAFITVAVWFPKVWTLLGGLTAILSACGLTFMLAELARYQGRQIESKMIATNGGKFTTIFLRHRDQTISSATKKSYHGLLKKKAKRGMPTTQDEDADPHSADDLYRSAVDWLLEATRSEKRFQLVRLENISYGFRRNLLGLKAPALLLLSLCIPLNVALCIRALHGDDTRFWAGCAVSSALVAALIVWIFVIRLPFVEDAGRSYALRLLAQCDVLQGSAAPGAKPTAT
jgi:hypothetical protein